MLPISRSGIALRSVSNVSLIRLCTRASQSSCFSSEKWDCEVSHCIVQADSQLVRYRMNCSRTYCCLSSSYIRFDGINFVFHRSNLNALVVQISTCLCPLLTLKDLFSLHHNSSPLHSSVIPTMLIYMTAFISTTFLPPFRHHCHTIISFRTISSPKTIHSPKISLPPIMRHNRFNPRFSRSSRRPPFTWHPSPHPHVAQYLRRAESLWSKSTSSERSLVALATVGALAIAGLTLNLVFHASLALVFVLVPLVFAPVLLVATAIFSMFAVMMFSAAGAGFFFVGTPFFAVTMLAKALFPFWAIATAAAFVIARTFTKWRRRDGIQTENMGMGREDGEYIGMKKAEEEAFERFDAKLEFKTAGVSKRGSDVMAWDLSDVVDELDERGLGEYRQLFIEERIDGRTLLALTNDDIKVEFGHCMPLGDRLKLSRLLTELRRQSSWSRLF